MLWGAHPESENGAGLVASEVEEAPALGGDHLEEGRPERERLEALRDR